jgi:hypothetical protein
MNARMILGISVLNLVLSAAAQAASSCALLREPNGGFAIHHTSAGRDSGQQLVLSCDADDGRGVSYRITPAPRHGPGAKDAQLAPLTGSCQGTCPVRINARGGAKTVPARQEPEVLLLTVDF